MQCPAFSDLSMMFTTTERWPPAGRAIGGPASKLGAGELLDRISLDLTLLSRWVVLFQHVPNCPSADLTLCVAKHRKCAGSCRRESLGNGESQGCKSVEPSSPCISLLWDDAFCSREPGTQKNANRAVLHENRKLVAVGMLGLLAWTSGCDGTGGGGSNGAPATPPPGVRSGRSGSHEKGLRSNGYSKHDQVVLTRPSNGRQTLGMLANRHDRLERSAVLPWGAKLSVVQRQRSFSTMSDAVSVGFLELVPNRI